MMDYRNADIVSGVTSFVLYRHGRPLPPSSTLFVRSCLLRKFRRLNYVCHLASDGMERSSAAWSNLVRLSVVQFTVPSRGSPTCT